MMSSGTPNRNNHTNVTLTSPSFTSPNTNATTSAVDTLMASALKDMRTQQEAAAIAALQGLSDEEKNQRINAAILAQLQQHQSAGGSLANLSNSANLSLAARIQAAAAQQQHGNVAGLGSAFSHLNQYHTGLSLDSLAALRAAASSGSQGTGSSPSRDTGVSSSLPLLSLLGRNAEAAAAQAQVSFQQQSTAAAAAASASNHQSPPLASIHLPSSAAAAVAAAASSQGGLGGGINSVTPTSQVGGGSDRGVHSFAHLSSAGVATPLSVTAMAAAGGSMIPIAPSTIKAAVQSPEGQRQAMIRRDKVEAALRSKPQRGRKRENLSELERLELTRTRNREHAKSTRIRKKQRAQELMEAEKQLRAVKEMSDLNESRRQAVVAFFRAWERRMQQEATPSSTKEQSTQPPEAEAEQSSAEVTSKVAAKPTSANEGATAGSGSCSDQSAQSDETSVAGNNVLKPCTIPEVSSLEDLIDVDSFRFEEVNAVAGMDQQPPGRSILETSGLTRFRIFEDALAASIVDRYGPMSVSSVCMNVKGNTRGVALSCDHTGFAHVDVTLESTKIPVTLMTAFIRFDFMPDSYSIRSVLWTSIYSTLNASQQAAGEGVATARGIGGNQAAAHPSVVSLEHNTSISSHLGSTAARNYNSSSSKNSDENTDDDEDASTTGASVTTNGTAVGMNI